MTTRILMAIALGHTFLLLAADGPKQKVEVSKTDRMDFPAGGALKLTNSVGVLTIEAWDRSDAEITTVKSAKNEIDPRDREKAVRELDKVSITTERHGDDLAIATSFPYRHFPPPYPADKELNFYPMARDVNFDLEYRIKVPANARVVVSHSIGQVNVDGVTGDIRVRVRQGQIMLHLPEDELCTITAKSHFGHVDSDFPGEQKRTHFMLGHQVMSKGATTAHKLNLDVDYGDIVILKTTVPKTPGPVAFSQKAASL